MKDITSQTNGSNCPITTKKILIWTVFTKEDSDCGPLCRNLLHNSTVQIKLSQE